MTQSRQVSRRAVVRSIVGGSFAIASPKLFATDVQTEDFSKLARYVQPKVSWSHAELNDFLDVLPDSGLISMMKALQLLPHDESDYEIPNRDVAIKSIKTQMLWYSSNIIAYPVRSEERINYQSLVKWVASQLRVDQWIVDTQPTLVIERAIQEQLFVELWDKLNVDQRKELLKVVDADGYIANHGAVAALGGAGALAALSLTVHLTGFAFYTTMSTVICTVAGFFGVTLPFAVYTGASSIVAFLSGPVGWALLAVAAAAGVALAGRANPQKTAAAICQIHSLKVAALQAANEGDATVFQVMADPLKRLLIGQWRFECEDEHVYMTLKFDGTFGANGYRLPSMANAQPELVWQGKGEWKVRDNALSIKRTHTWHFYWAADERLLCDHCKVLDITPTSVRLAKGGVMKRV